jgi:hypothetical protein
MSEYIKHCVYCKSEIKMSNKNEGKWLPYNLDGSEHDCKPHTNGSINGGDTNKSEAKKYPTVEERLARLEEAVFGDTE